MFNTSKEECNMVQIIAGNKGKGKTKILLDKANTTVAEAKGTVVYLDKSSKHMHELSKQIRLINLFDYPIRSYNAFIGFICGILSQDYDKEYFFLDSFLKLSHLEGQDISAAIDELASLSETYKVTFVLSVSMDESQLPENAKKYLIASL